MDYELQMGMRGKNPWYETKMVLKILPPGSKIIQTSIAVFMVTLIKLAQDLV